MKVFYDERMLEHKQDYFHPEKKERLERSKEVLDENGIKTYRPREFDEEIFKKVHDEEYLNFLKKFRGYLTPDTIVRENTYGIAKISAFCSLSVGETLLKGENAFALNRPPGHHACRDHGGGFCYLNNIAIAAHYLKEKGIERVFILDWDGHHGNGTQEAFYNINWVYYLSIHQKGIYPFTGYEHETGEGEGKGFNRNIPVPYGIGDKDYLKIFDKIVLKEIENYKPDLILISAGQDSHRNDPLVGLNLSTETYGTFIKKIRDYTVGAVLEGGYDLNSLAYSNLEIIREMSI